MLRRISARGFSALIGLLIPLTGHGADSTSTWTNATSGEWDAAANWTPSTFFPNNGNGGFATHDAVIDATGSNYTVTLDSNVTIEDLILDSANATVRHTTGDFTATGGIDLMAGTYTLNGGNISGTTIHLLGGTMSFAFNDFNRLSNNALLDGDLNLMTEFASRVRLQTGATFSGDANLTAEASRLGIEYTTTLDNKTINYDGPSVWINIEGGTTLTFGPNLLLRGRGGILGPIIVPGTSALVNQGTLRADVTGQSLNVGIGGFGGPLGSLTNENLAEATGGGILLLQLGLGGVITNITGNTLTGGTWRAAGSGSRVDLDFAQIQTNAAEIILDGAGSRFRSATVNIFNFVDLETTLATNAAGGALRILGGRDYTATAGSFVNSGGLELGGGSFTAPMLTNTATGEISGFGTINNDMINQGLVRGISSAQPIAINGRLSGTGSLANVRIDGTHAPGLSAAAVDLASLYRLANSATLEIEIGGPTAGSQYDQLNSTGTVELDGVLRVIGINAGAGVILPTVGQTFTIITAAGGVTGTFDTPDPHAIVSGSLVDYSIVYGTNGVMLKVDAVTSLLPGDYNGNGVVDAADYVVWRHLVGSNNLAADGNINGEIDAGDYDVWRANFGRAFGSGTATGSGPPSPAATPEPGNLLLLAAGGIIVAVAAARSGPHRKACL